MLCKGASSSQISPDEAVSSPANRPKSVDLPEPEAPIIAMDWPASTEKVIGWRICSSPSLVETVLIRFSVFIMKILSLYGWLLCVVFSTASYAAIDQSTSTASNTQTETQTVLILGDSLSAAYGLTQEEGWVSLLQNMLSQSADPTLSSLTLINASISGETTDGGLARLARLLTQHNPDHILIELGGNDGLQGHSIKKLKNNLRAIVKQSQSANVQVAIQQMQIPTNYGARYNRMFISAFSDVAAEFDVPLVPFFLADIALNPELMQSDGIHPTAEAQPMIAEFMLTHWITPLVALY